MERFANRTQAGRTLATALHARELPRAVVLGLPRGGVPVAAEVAAALEAPLDVLVVRKIGVPGHEEVAMGAVGEGDAVVRNDDVITMARVSGEAFARARVREGAEVERRVAMFREGRAGADLRGRTAVVVDDGVATGATARAACAIARARGAASVVLAVPVGAADALTAIDADDVVCLDISDDFMAVGMHYVDFRQVADSEVIELLRQHAA